MDAGKAVALTARGDLDLWAFDFDKDPPNLTTGSTFPLLVMCTNDFWHWRRN